MTDVGIPAKFQHFAGGPFLAVMKPYWSEYPSLHLARMVGGDPEASHGLFRVSVFETGHDSGSPRACKRHSGALVPPCVRQWGLESDNLRTIFRQTIYLDFKLRKEYIGYFQSHAKSYPKPCELVCYLLLSLFPFWVWGKDCAGNLIKGVSADTSLWVPSHVGDLGPDKMQRLYFKKRTRNKEPLGLNVLSGCIHKPCSLWTVTIRCMRTGKPD